MRISDWSSDVCSSDLRSRKTGRGYCFHGSGFSREPLAGCACGSGLQATSVTAACPARADAAARRRSASSFQGRRSGRRDRSEEHTSELQSLMRISYAVFCLKKKKKKKNKKNTYRIKK